MASNPQFVEIHTTMVGQCVLNVLLYVIASTKSANMEDNIFYIFRFFSDDIHQVSIQVCQFMSLYQNELNKMVRVIQDIPPNPEVSWVGSLSQYTNTNLLAQLIHIHINLFNTTPMDRVLLRSKVKMVEDMMSKNLLSQYLKETIPVYHASKNLLLKFTLNFKTEGQMGQQMIYHCIPLRYSPYVNPFQAPLAPPVPAMAPPVAPVMPLPAPAVAVPLKEPVGPSALQPYPLPAFGLATAIRSNPPKSDKSPIEEGIPSSSGPPVFLKSSNAFSSINLHKGTKRALEDETSSSSSGNNYTPLKSTETPFSRISRESVDFLKWIRTEKRLPTSSDVKPYSFLNSTNHIIGRKSEQFIQLLISIGKEIELHTSDSNFYSRYPNLKEKEPEEKRLKMEEPAPPSPF